MKLKIIAFLATIACVGFAKADYLYWQVGTSQQYKTGGNIDFTYAQIYSGAYATGTLLTNYASGGGASGTNIGAGSKMYASGVGTAESSSIYVVLYNGSNEEVAHSEAISYANYSQYIETAAFSSNWTSMSASSPLSSFTFVPEPTSGLLMLVGAALLGLRRKRIA